jgi:hypothetical protein
VIPSNGGGKYWEYTWLGDRMAKNSNQKDISARRCGIQEKPVDTKKQLCVWKGRREHSLEKDQKLLSAPGLLCEVVENNH